MKKEPLTIEEILLLLERARMDDVSQRLRELWADAEDLKAAPRLLKRWCSDAMSVSDVKQLEKETIKFLSSLREMQ